MNISNRKIHVGISESDYRAMPGLSKTDLGCMAESPIHFKTRGEFKETPSMRLGTIVHMAILEPKKFAELMIVEPTFIDGEKINRNKHAHKDWLKKFYEDNSGKMILTQKEYDSTVGMVNACARKKKLIRLLANGTPEVAATWEVNGRPCKGRADFLVEHPIYGKTIIELKTTVDASVDGFEKQIVNRKYDIGFSWYKEGFGADKVIFVAVQSKPPYICLMQGVPFYMIDGGKEEAMKYFNQIEDCEKKGHYPDYFGEPDDNTDLVDDASYPAWRAGSTKTDDEGDLVNGF